MSSDNPLSDAAEGITKGVLDWSVDRINLFIQKLKEKKLAFIQESRTIEIVKEQYRCGEAVFYEKYIKNKSFLFLVRLGLTLRRLEGDEDRLRNLRDKIFKKYNVEGLHVAEFVQNGILNRYIGLLLEELVSIEKLEKDIEEVLKNIEKHTLFVQWNRKISDILKEADIKVRANSPNIFIISGFKSVAKIVSENIDSFKILLEDYEFERFSGGEKEILFFKKFNLVQPLNKI